MNKPAIEAALNRYLDATTHALINIRDEGGSCQLCQALRGEQHLPTCPLWPLIDSRISFRMEQETSATSPEMPRDKADHCYGRAA